MRGELDSMWWASFVSVECEDGEVRSVAGTSGTFEQAQREQEIVLRTIRMMTPDARIIDCYYISRHRT